MKRFHELVLGAVREGYSDLHITGGQPIVIRRHGAIHFDTRVVYTHEDVDSLVRKMLNDKQLNQLRSRLSVDLAMSVANVRIRVNVFNTIRGLSIAVRLLSGSAPTIGKLNLHPSLQEICRLKSGLVLLCGATGCGKSTTIAAIVNEINLSRSAHIITLEDPIEYRFPCVKAFIEQRELGPHVPSFQQGLIDVLRENPDVIVVGELREAETIRLTLNAAEAGHLVIATLHATNAEDAVYRLINSAPLEVQEQIRFQLASTVSWIIIQQLFYLDRVKFRVPLLSILRGVQSIKGIIRENKLPQLENALHTGKHDGMFTMERYMTEYLSTRDSFIHPSQVFRPSPEDVLEAVYVSPLLAEAPAVPKRGVPPRAGAAPADSVRRAEEREVVEVVTPEDGMDQHYVIYEEANLEELIAQIGKPK